MNDPRAPAQGRSRALLWSLLVVFIVLVCALFYLGLVAARGSYAYYQFKIMGHAWVGAMWRADPELGYAHVPGFRGEQSIADGFSVEVRIDEDGFRVPAVEGPKGARPLVLALGDSVTFGQACEAEDTYPFRVAEALQGSAMNSAVSGWGLSQMLIRAERLIPRSKPDYVIALYAGWLLQRSWVGFSQTKLAAIPTPYFVATAGEGLRTAPPAAEPLVFGMGLQRYWATEPGVLDYLSFVSRAAIPLLIHNDMTRSALWLRWNSGMIPPPVQDPERIAETIYSRLAQLSRENEATLVIVSWPAKPNAMLEALPGVVVSYPYRRLRERLPGATQEEFSRAYHHWHGSPPVMVDAHPNVLFHSLIAEDILAAMRAAGTLE